LPDAATSNTPAAAALCTASTRIGVSGVLPPMLRLMIRTPSETSFVSATATAGSVR
jgi:hypothetical protein